MGYAPHSSNRHARTLTCRKRQDFARRDGFVAWTCFLLLTELHSNRTAKERVIQRPPFLSCEDLKVFELAVRAHAGSVDEKIAALSVLQLEGHCSLLGSAQHTLWTRCDHHSNHTHCTRPDMCRGMKCIPIPMDLKSQTAVLTWLGVP